VTTPQIGILIVDDHRIMRDGLALIVERESDMQVVGAASTGEEAIVEFSRRRPEIVLMDLQMPGIGGVEAIRAIHESDPTARIVVLTMYEGDEDIYRALDAGASTYLLKDSLSDDLIRVIREVHAGERPISPEIRARLNHRNARAALTKREVEVLELLLDGRRNKEIAFSLSISEETVEVHLKNIFNKLDVHDRTAAVSTALRRGIIHVR
jgi:DNA-binding NarL/FixJ family response regulator